MKILARIVLLLVCITAASLSMADEIDKKNMLAIEYLEISKTKETLEATINQSVDQLANANPDIDKDQLKKFFSSYMGWEEIKYPLTKSVSEILTEDELIAVNGFYKTKHGLAYAEKSPALASAISEIITQNLINAISKLKQNSVSDQPSLQ